MAKTGIINLSSLKDQVYEYLRHQMKIGAIRPDSVINMDSTSKKLGVSKTPLRDALLQLEMEGFVTILPRRGVIVNKLTLQDIKDYYQILGALESTAIIAVSESLKPSDIKKMEKLNQGMKSAIERDNFDAFYERNLAFHDVYINKAGNRMLRRTVDILKKRLYDFPRRKGYIKEWEETSIKEHQQLVNLLAESKFLDAANFIRDVHWSFKVQKKFIKKYYPLKEDNKG
jgi:DNA-binding GntR family transcriptional regulator